jgi:HPt (histidine-containing phosphotransfer) domain-containing protein
MVERELCDPAEAVMDTTVLCEFLEMVGPSGPELLRNIATTYTVETPPVLMALGMALERNDHKAAMRLAHRLKGSCLSIGASRLAASCAAVERACSVGEPPSGEAYFTLRRQFDATSIALREFLEELPA